MPNWVVVVIPDGDRPPSVVGTFTSSDKAALFGNVITDHVDGKVKIATLEPIPPDYT